MHKIFYPDSIAIWGLSSKENNIPRLIVENLIRWGFKGQIIGIHPNSQDFHVDGIQIYKHINEVPTVPDLAVFLLPARFIPEALDQAGHAGIRRAAIPAGGFNESGEKGTKLSEELMQVARKHKIRFVGPNGLTVANTANGLCLPFLPIFSPPSGGMSIITQSGGVGIFLWNLLGDENIGMAKFASIGNKLDITETDCIEYFGTDPETKVICMYLESISNGRALIEAAMKINKPLVVFKANTTPAGNKAAMSHTAAVSNNDDIINSAFERAGITRIHNFAEFISAAKAFELPPLKGNRLMVMSPAGGFTVMLADLCEKEGFIFADPGKDFFKDLESYVNSGVVSIANPLDLGDIYSPKAFTDIFHMVLHNENVDGAVFVTQNPLMPKSDDVFYRMFKTDISKDIIGSMRSSGKPFATCLYAPEKTMSKTKRNLKVPIFNSPERMVKLMKQQYLFHKKKSEGPFETRLPKDLNLKPAQAWIDAHKGVTGEDTLDLLAQIGISTPVSGIARTLEDAQALARKLGYPLVMKVISPDALHKSDAGGVIVDIKDDAALKQAFDTIRSNLTAYKKDARFEGVRLMEMAKPGHDMFIGAHVDDSFGPVATFGFGGIFIEVFSDVENVLCPTNQKELDHRIRRLKSYKILQGTRGNKKADINAYLDLIEKISHLMAAFPDIQELDLNPVRVFEDGSGAVALDARIRID
ncbi:MAG: acetate--CoA ligase family protein [Proteobacteria bacterium]|nr:acetate--CoA ligase family protein [Pseudomonadota bacterium]MBU1388567.1 acetate--CoA ligase family protein [Pseudomonadota bacterium]MBU1541391.1 acetate--CoA ligase family protein [Pseudomonadota bacterium]MBU2480926.1 acetate--CoA ligase family protein [Pseudomonadota bacterium]